VLAIPAVERGDRPARRHNCATAGRVRRHARHRRVPVGARPVLFFAWSDYLLFGWSVPFALLIVLRLATLGFALSVGYHLLKTTDALTGVLNRRRLSEIAGLAVGEARRQHRALAMIAVDLDHFKRGNDQYGHAAGDDVLAAFARVLREQTQTQDVIGRIGGEDLAIVLPGTSLQAARDVAERIRTALHAGRVTVEESAISVTVSLGVAALRPGDESPENLLKRVDRALYAARRHGRDRVEAA